MIHAPETFQREGYVSAEVHSALEPHTVDSMVWFNDPPVTLAGRESEEWFGTGNFQVPVIVLQPLKCNQITIEICSLNMI